MKLPSSLLGANRLRLGVASVAALGLLVSLPGTAQAATPIPLGTADSFAVLAHKEITNGGTTTIDGDVGLDEGTLASITGFNDVTQTPGGTVYAADAVALTAQGDLQVAYDNAAQQVPTGAVGVELSSPTAMGPGVYSGGELEITGTLTLDGQGDPNAMFVFNAASTLVTGPGSRVELINGAQPCNVFWQITSSATLGSASTFQGSIMALANISVDTGATVKGRLLARTGSVTLLANTITRPVCATSTPTPTPSPTSQVAKVPTGSVSTGNGSSSTGVAPYAVLGALVVAGIGGAASVAVRRRRLNG